MKDKSVTRISRRQLLKAAGLAAGSLSISAGLGACAPPPAAAPQQPAPPAQPSPTEAPASGTVSKTLLLAIQGFAHEAMKPVLAKWEEKTGHKVTLESGPVTGNEMITKYAPAFQSGVSPVDVMSDADDSGPSFYRAGWMEPLDEAIPQETWDDFPESFKQQIEVWHSFDGKRYRVPHEFAIGYTFYRKDWFDERKIEPPKTWDEVVTIGKEFTNPPVFGTMEALIKPALAFVYIAYLTAQSGGNPFAFDDATAQAFQFAYDLIHTHKIMPETTLAMDYTQQNEEYMKDHVAFMRQWPFFWDVARGNKGWYQEGKAEITLPPAGPAGAKSWWGGWGFSVPKFAPNKAEALDLIAFITNNENAPILAKGQSWFVMPRKSIMAVMGNEGLAVHMQRYAEANVPSPRPFHPKVAEAQSVVDDVAALYLTKQISLSEAMTQGKERIAALG
ncbi:MAG: extracellular solute-binding protein [Anaerolineae bacterium]|nr:extracellular solute-binding protein [Anaerolineae bacterium]